MIDSARELPYPSFTVPELSSLLGYSAKALYPNINSGALSAHEDCIGVLRVSYADAVSFAEKKLPRQ